MSKKNRQHQVEIGKNQQEQTAKYAAPIPPPVPFPAELMDIDPDSQAIRLLKLQPGDIVAIGVKTDDVPPEAESAFLRNKSEYLKKEFPEIKFLLFPLGRVQLSVLREKQADK